MEEGDPDMTWIDKKAYISFGFKIDECKCEITIEPRPHYCDRGNYIAKMFDNGLVTDHQDGWPRYYFDLNVAKAECEAWVEKRKKYSTKAV